MSAVPRDPVFWKRFSVAAHMDMEKGGVPSGKLSPGPSLRDDSNPSQSWLDAQYKKRSRNQYCLCLSSLAFVGGLAFIILVLVYLNNHGWYLHGEKFAFP